MAILRYNPATLTDEDKAVLDRIGISEEEELKIKMHEYITSGKYKADSEKLQGKPI